LDERDELIAAMFAASPYTLEEFMERYHRFLLHLQQMNEARQPKGATPPRR
jgi:hypothetical protein